MPLIELTPLPLPRILFRRRILHRTLTLFRGVSALARHRLVYAALDDMLKTDIHALAIEALPPGVLLIDNSGDKG